MAISNVTLAGLTRIQLLETHYKMALLRRFEEKAAEEYTRGKITGCSKGKGGSMHMWSNELGLLGGNAIVGAQLPIAAGIALAMQYQGLDTIVVCFFGDGAVDEGAFHEALNLASIWKLPVIFICENNQYSMGMAVEKAWAVDSLLPRAAAHNVPAEQVDGMDVVKVYEA